MKKNKTRPTSEFPMTRLEKESLKWDINYYKQQSVNIGFEIEKLKLKRIAWNKLMAKAIKKLRE